MKLRALLVSLKTLTTPTKTRSFVATPFRISLFHSSSLSFETKARHNWQPVCVCSLSEERIDRVSVSRIAFLAKLKPQTNLEQKQKRLRSCRKKRDCGRNNLILTSTHGVPQDTIPNSWRNRLCKRICHSNTSDKLQIGVLDGRDIPIRVPKPCRSRNKCDIERVPLTSKDVNWGHRTARYGCGKSLSQTIYHGATHHRPCTGTRVKTYKASLLKIDGKFLRSRADCVNIEGCHLEILLRQDFEHETII